MAEGRAGLGRSWEAAQVHTCSESIVLLLSLSLLEYGAGGGEVEDGGVLDVWAEVLPEQVGVHTLHAMARVEGTMDGHTRVLRHGHFGELVATRLVDEGLNSKDLTNRILPLVQVVRCFQISKRE